MLYLALSWIAWCILHSLLITSKAHLLSVRVLGRFAGAYRFLYVLFSVVSLIPVLWLQFSLTETLIMEATLPVRLLQLTLLIYAAFMFYMGARAYDMGYFLGIAQLQRAEKGDSEGKLPFHTDGVLAYVRHPWYSGGIAFVWGFGAITDIFLLTRVILTGYLIIGTILEEKRLTSELGEDYTAYCKKVPMLLPWKLFR